MGSSTNLRRSRVVAINGHCAPWNGAPTWRPDDELVLRNRLTALVVDSSEFQRIFHRTLLASFRVEIWEVENGRDAVGLVEAGINFDLIIIDMDLPVLDGASTTRTLRGMGVGCMIVGTAAYNDRERDQQVFIESGLDDYYEDQLTYDKLMPILRRIDGQR